MKYEDLLDIVHHSDLFVKEERRALFTSRAEKIINHINQMNGVFAQFYQREIEEQERALLKLIKNELYNYLKPNCSNKKIDLPYFQSIDYFK